MNETDFFRRLKMLIQAPCLLCGKPVTAILRLEKFIKTEVPICADCLRTARYNDIEREAGGRTPAGRRSVET